MRNQRHPKSWKSFDDQLDALISRGLIVEDRERALNYLKRIGYYRLSGYWFPFRQVAEHCPLTDTHQKPKKIKVERIRLDYFRDGASFQNAIDLYVFDKKLRLIALDALERVEVALRVDIAHLLGEKDRFAYLSPVHFHRRFAEDLQVDCLTRHHKWLSKQAGLISRSKEEFIEHNVRRYGRPIPIWVSCEVWDFGAMSTLYDGMKEEDQDRISQRYGVSNGRIFATWLRSLNYLRNICAHHSRLWNKNVVDQPKLPSRTEVAFVATFEGNPHLRARPYLLFRILLHLLKTVNPASSWADRVSATLKGFPDLEHIGLNLGGMGVEPDWEETWAPK